MQTLTEDETMYERVKEMREQVHRDGIQQGLERGRAEGRALVGRLATRKFGSADCGATVPGPGGHSGSGNSLLR